MAAKKPISAVTIVGMGALGMLFGGLIQDTLGPGSVTFAAAPERIEKYRKMQFSINGKPVTFPFAAADAAAPAELVMVAVKDTALESALDTMRGFIGPDTTVISVLNGISSEEKIAARYGAERIIYTVAQGMDAVKFGGELHYTKPGELHVGITGRPGSAGTARLEALTDFLHRAGVPCFVEADILHRMWAKFMLNVGVNQCCMAFETDYGGAVAPGRVRDTMVAAMREVQKLAACEGITLEDAERNDYLTLLAELAPRGMPSMRQDGMAHRLSEVELFAGTVCRLADKYKLEVPTNRMLYAKIKAMEASYGLGAEK